MKRSLIENFLMGVAFFAGITSKELESLNGRSLASLRSGRRHTRHHGRSAEGEGKRGGPGRSIDGAN